MEDICMKVLVVFYSKTGTTKKLAEKLAHALGADIEELIDTRKRSGIIGWMTSGRDGMRKLPTVIAPVEKDPADYDLVLVGGPLWGFNSIAPAARTYLTTYRESLKRAGFFVTRGGDSPAEAAIADLCQVYGREIAGTIDICQKDIDSEDTDRLVGEFSDKILA
jgi:flavodoxin